MDGVDGLDPVIELHPPVLLPQEHGDQGSVPVIGVDDVRVEVDVLQALEHRLREVRHALAVVPVAVGAVPVEVVLVVQEVVADLAQLQGKHAAVLHAPAQRYAEGREELHLVVILLGDLPELRKNHPNLAGRVLQRRGQTARHVAQTAGLDEGRGLEGGE